MVRQEAEEVLHQVDAGWPHVEIIGRLSRQEGQGWGGMTPSALVHHQGEAQGGSCV